MISLTTRTDPAFSVTSVEIRVPSLTSAIVLSDWQNAHVA